MKTIFTYFHQLSNTNQYLELQKIDLWTKSWEKAGWKTAVLNQGHARCSGYITKIYRLISEAIPNIQDRNPAIEDLFRARLERLCGLHAAGGGWLSDYDVVNTGFTPQMAEECEKNSFVLSGNPAYLIRISNEIINAAISRILNSNLIVEGKILYEQDIFNPFLNLESEFTLHLPDYENMKKIFLEKN